MAEHDASIGLDQTAHHRSVFSRSARPHVGHDPTHERCVTGGLRSGDEQEELSRVAERPHLSKKVLLEPSSDGERLTDGAAPSELFVGQLGSKLDQRERTTTRLDDYPLGELGVNLCTDSAGEQLQGCVVG
jgi:hypothetical protein